LFCKTILDPHQYWIFQFFCFWINKTAILSGKSGKGIKGFAHFRINAFALSHGDFSYYLILLLEQ